MRTPPPGSSPKRLLIVYPHLPHYRYGVFRKISAHPGFEVTFAADNHSSGSGIDVIPLSTFRTRRLRNHYFGHLLWQGGLIRLVRSEPWDAVIFLGSASYVSTWLAALILRARGVLVLFWTIGWHRPDRGLRRYLRRAFYSLADHLLLYGRTAMELGIAMGQPAERMTVIGNSYDSHQRSEAVAKDELERIGRAIDGRAPFTVVAVGRLTAIKRLDLLVESVARVATARGRITVILAGDGPEGPALVELAQRLGVDLRMVGTIYSDEALAALYENASVTVVPGAAGLTVIQSLQHGVPVVTHGDAHSQMPEFEAVIPARTGSLFEKGSVESLADELRSWMELPADEAGRRSQEARREVARRWSSDAHAAHLIDTVTDLLTSRRPG
jgi:glycosyltransferase involved in cell wall biosynthesis